MAINYNPQGTLIINEMFNVKQVNEDLSLEHDLFLSIDFTVKNQQSELIYGQDYLITNMYERLKQECGLTCYRHLRIINQDLLNLDLTVTYRAVADFVNAEEVLFVKDTDNRYLKQSECFEDLPDKQIAMNNISRGFEYDTVSLESNETIVPVMHENIWYKATFLRIWNYIKTKIENVLGLSDTQYNGKLSKKITFTKGSSVVEFDGSENTDVDLSSSIYQLTIKTAGSTLTTFDGSESKTANITLDRLLKEKQSSEITATTSTTGNATISQIPSTAKIISVSVSGSFIQDYGCNIEITSVKYPLKIDNSYLSVVVNYKVNTGSNSSGQKSFKFSVWYF